MSEDWWVAIERVENAAADLHEVLERAVDALREARSEQQAGVGNVDIVKALGARGGKTLRLAPTVAFHDYERAVADYRASMIRTLVDDDHMTFTEVGELAGVSRQMIARLYSVGGSASGKEDKEGVSPPARH